MFAVKPVFDRLSDTVSLPAAAIWSLPAPGFEGSGAAADYRLGLSFLRAYAGSADTFNAYRRELERLFLWCRANDRCFTRFSRQDVEEFLRFCRTPPAAWQAESRCPRFIGDGPGRKPNPAWRPFVANESLSPASQKSQFAAISAFFRFLVDEQVRDDNPALLTRQRRAINHTVADRRAMRVLSAVQQDAVLEACHRLAEKSPERHERTLFVVQLVLDRYLRVSDLVDDKRPPQMRDFQRDGEGRWWICLLGKGNKQRNVAATEAALEALRRWRQHLGLPPLPSPADATPLLPSERGGDGIRTTRQIRRIIQAGFDAGVALLQARGQMDEADSLAAATAHWLRHTGITEDVKDRPLLHVSLDAGHADIKTTSGYIRTLDEERHRTAVKRG